MEKKTALIFSSFSNPFFFKKRKRLQNTLRTKASSRFTCKKHKLETCKPGTPKKRQLFQGGKKQTKGRKKNLQPALLKRHAEPAFLKNFFLLSHLLAATSQREKFCFALDLVFFSFLWLQALHAGWLAQRFSGRFLFFKNTLPYSVFSYSFNTL